MAVENVAKHDVRIIRPALSKENRTSTEERDSDGSRPRYALLEVKNDVEDAAEEAEEKRDRRKGERCDEDFKNQELLSGTGPFETSSLVEGIA